MVSQCKEPEQLTGGETRYYFEVTGTVSKPDSGGDGRKKSSTSSKNGVAAASEL